LAQGLHELIWGDATVLVSVEVPKHLSCRHWAASPTSGHDEVLQQLKGFAEWLKLRAQLIFILRSPKLGRAKLLPYLHALHRLLLKQLVRTIRLNKRDKVIDGNSVPHKVDHQEQTVNLGGLVVGEQVFNIWKRQTMLKLRLIQPEAVERLHVFAVKPFCLGFEDFIEGVIGVG
jgi:hypothetical protein